MGQVESSYRVLEVLKELLIYSECDGESLDDFD